MRRKIINMCAMLSLILCTAAVWWWIGRNPANVDQITFQPNNSKSLSFMASDGKVVFSKTVHDVPVTPGLKQLNWGTTPVDPDDKTLSASKSSWGGFAFVSEPLSSKSQPGMATFILIPAWMLVGFFSLLPLMRVVTILKRYKLAVAAA